MGTIICFPDRTSNIKSSWAKDFTLRIFSPPNQAATLKITSKSSINISFAFGQLLTYESTTSVHFELAASPIEI